MRKRLLIPLLLFSYCATAQFYFPSINSAEWDTVATADLNWSKEKVDALDQFLVESNTKGFIYLKDGKIAKESYYNGHSQTEAWYWASAGKGLTAFLMGIAQEQGLLNLEDSTSDYLGQWTNCAPGNERAIKLVHQLSMTSGLDYNGDLFCTDQECLACLHPPGEEWYYHNAPYTLLDEVIESASGRTLNQYTRQNLLQKIGMSGVWTKLGFNNVFFSTTRNMARFGLLILNNGVWDNDTLLADPIYFQNMIAPSQDINPAYGYLWWLNGADSFRLPGSTDDFPGKLIPDAPDDLFMAIGANGQFIFVLPSSGEVIIRTGENTGNELVPLFFGRTLWELLGQLKNTTSIGDQMGINKNEVSLYPNPTSGLVQVKTLENVLSIEVFSPLGRLLQHSSEAQVDIHHLPAGSYIFKIRTSKFTVSRCILKL